MAPVVPNDFKSLIVSVSGNLCAAFLRLILQLPVKIYQLTNYMFTGTGTINELFLRDITPAGSLLFSASSLTPTGYVLANGAAVPRSIAAGGLADTYKYLWDAIGTTYGIGDGTTTFNLPDFNGRIPIGAGTTAGLVDEAGGGLSGASYSAGAKGGFQDVQLTMAQLPASPPPLGSKVDSLLVIKSSAITAEDIYSVDPTNADVVRRDNINDDPTDNVLANLGTGARHTNMPPWTGVFVYVKI